MLIWTTCHQMKLTWPFPSSTAKTSGGKPMSASSRSTMLTMEPTATSHRFSLKLDHSLRSRQTPRLPPRRTTNQRKMRSQRRRLSQSSETSPQNSRRLSRRCKVGPKSIRPLRTSPTASSLNHTTSPTLMGSISLDQSETRVLVALATPSPLLRSSSPDLE